MKAPNKIYLAWEYSEIDTLPPGVTSKQVFGKDVCYIRKEALLKWLTKQMTRPNSRGGKTWNLALQTLINKLNEM